MDKSRSRRPTAPILAWDICPPSAVDTAVILSPGFANAFKAAIFVLVIEITGSELALGGILALRMLAFAVPQPFTGMLADMYNRKKIMVIANVLSSIVALCLIFIDGSDDLVLLYFLVFLLMALHALEVPASRAALPNFLMFDT